MISRGIGERLRSAREARGLSLEEIEAGTRIRRQYLRALEAEAFDEIPGPAYVKGFLRTYATYLGLSSDDLAALAPEISSATVIPGTILPPGSAIEVRITPVPRRSRIRRIIAGVALILVLGVAVFGYLLYGQLRQFAVTRPPILSGARPPISAPVRPGAAASPSPGPTVMEPPRSPGPTSPPKTAVTAPLPPGTSSASPDSPRAPAPQVASPRASSPPSTPPAAPSSSPTPAPPGTPPAGSPAPAAQVSPGGSLVFPGPLHVVIVATDRTWVRVVADGVTVFEGFMSAGTRQAWEARRELSLKAGNAGGLDVSVNGRSLGRLGNPGDAVDKTFTAGGAASP